MKNTSYNEWFKLDNAAKIFPIVSSESNTNTFRISFTLFENIDSSILQKAVEIALPRFPSMSVRLRRGFFWYFFDHNNKKPMVKQENPRLYKKFKAVEENGFLFRVMYYGKRITLEMFHSLADGFGGLEFIKAIVFHYLEQKGYDVKSNNLIKIASSPYELREIEDSYFINYKKSTLDAMKGEKAYNVPGINFIQGGSGLIYGECDSIDFINLAKSYNSTVSEFLISVYVFSLMSTDPYITNSKRPISIFVPVNLRKFFKSETLRNFSSFAKVNFKTLNTTYTFEEILEIVKEEFKKQLNKDILTDRMSGPVSAERMIIVRALPLFIKKPVMKLFYKFIGESINTSSISNMGVVKLPESMEHLVDKVNFSFASTNKNRINIAAGSFNGKLTITFSRTIVETRIEKFFFNFLSQKIKFTIYSNSWEEDCNKEKLPFFNRTLTKEEIALRNKKYKSYKAIKRAEYKAEKTKKLLEKKTLTEAKNKLKTTNANNKLSEKLKNKEEKQFKNNVGGKK